MIAIIELDYEAEKILKELPEEDYNDICSNITQLNLSEEKEKFFYIYGEKLIDLETDGVLLSKYKIPFKVKRFKNNLWLDKFDKKKEVSPYSQVSIHIPNIGLLAINEVDVLGNCCTNELQKKLDEGWRILCVCPPNEQRRPDYIIGRSTHTLEG